MGALLRACMHVTSPRALSVHVYVYVRTAVLQLLERATGCYANSLTVRCTC